MPDPWGRWRAGRFATTRWSLVLAAGDASPAHASEALSVLCELYWYPVYAFVRRHGYSADDSADLTQAFFARLLEKHFLRGADPARGQFRAFLRTSVRHFLANERDRSRALKRGGPRPPVSLDAQAAEDRYRLEPQDDLTPERLFDRRWAQSLLARVLARLRDEHESAGKLAAFEQMKGYLNGDEVRPYADLATALGSTEGAVKVAVFRFRRRFRDLLVEEIAATVSGPEGIDGEIDALMNALRS